MNEIDPNTVDLVYCDLPYGTTQCKWDTVIDLDKWWALVWKVCKPNAAVVLHSAQPFTATLVNSQIKYFKYDWVWEKSKATNYLNAKKQPLRAHESICVFYKKPPVYNPQMTQGTAYNKGTAESEGKLHPTQKPIALAEYIIKTYTNEGDVMCDPTMGSATACLAARNLNRDYIGIELEEEYFFIAEQRLHAKSQIPISK